MRTTMLFLALLLVSTTAATAAERQPEFRLFTAAYVPTGEQSDVLKSALLVGGQAGLELATKLHLVGTFAYARPSPERLTIADKVNFYQYDVGLEMFRAYTASRQDDHWTFRPFLGVGAGGRTYDLKDVDAKATTNLAGYGAVGAEMQHLNIAMRLEARDYVSRFKGLTGNDKASTRNDLVLGGGLAFHF